ncbi:autotransporter-associated beta strand repeat protein [Chthoniobacter flavus Ellin428]|uniref:Autotransporter-associated beta strand repeat protein n=1 Tax=Chthoniobacter flavus Ellin428 TaxID=497964 RepID=B4CYR9_9BACT|nr:autotransporter-associated beta strand repeat-containing protein [Chthoniobacter flavus]EDY20610.1 autotransporter-associated beta strand repeat protein [Chthoniobacter flavus Ellin428]TCO89883.1 putative secreted protein with PEP-CTERM sorting signal [Chthoniobacter flavus]
MKFPHHAVQSPRITRSNRRRRYCTRVCGILATNIAVLLGLQSINAATYYWDTNGATAGSGAATGPWDGSTANWTTDSTGSILPTVTLTTSADDLIFSAGTNGTTGTITVTGAQAANSLTFKDNVALTISGGTSLTLGGAGVNSGITVASGDNSSNTISTAIVLDASTTALGFTNNGTGLLTIGAITGSATSGTQTVTVNSTSTGGITLNGIIGNGSGGGTVAMVINNSGTGVTTLSGVNTFTGGLMISQGTLSYAANTALGGASGTAGAVTLNGGTLLFTGGSVDNTHAITVGASGGTIKTTGAGTFRFGIANTLLGSGPLTIIGNGSLVTTGQGVVVLNNSNTYNGNVTLQSGGVIEYANPFGLAPDATVTVGNAGNLSASTVTIANAVTVNAGGVLGFQNSGFGVFAGSITLNGAATAQLKNWYNATAQNGTITGNISGTGSLTISNNTATLTLLGANTYTGNTVIGTGATLLDVEPISRTYAAVISGAGAYIKDGLSTLTLTGVNTYTGATTIRGGTLTVGDGTSGSLASTTTLTFADTGTFNFQGVSTGSSQSLGATTFNAGAAGTVQSTYGTSGNTSLTLSNVVARPASATANFVVSGGTLTGATPTNKIVFTQVAGATPTTGALLDKGYYFNGADFAAYDTNGYVRALAYGTDTNTVAPDTITAANSVKLTATPAGQSSISLLTLNLAGSGVSWANNASQTLTLSGGGLIKSGGGTVGTISGGTGITTGGAVEFVVRTDTASDLLDIQTPITSTSTSGLTKTGLGTLTLSAANAYTGVTTVDQGTLSVTGSIGSTGATVVTSGILSVSGSGSINPLSGTTSTILIGNIAGAQAAVYQSGASSVVKNTSSGGGGFAIGSAVGGQGYYNVSGGTINVGGEINVGGTSGGQGTFGELDMSGGTMNLGTLSNTTTPFFLPARGAAGEAGVVNISGGTVQVNSGNTAANTNISGLAVGLNNVGNLYSVITISGSGQFLTPSHTVKLNDTNFGNAAGGSASNTSVLNMNGGTLQTLGFGTAVNAGGGNNFAVLNFNGGVLKAGTAGNTSFMSSLGAVNVYSGGGTIDNNSQAITIGQALLAASGTGVSSVALSSGGAGYIVPPRVVFVGGVTTSGLLANTATGYATIDPITGAVTGIVITNPGSYTSTAGLTVQLVGGGTGTTGATLGALTTNGGNTSGGLTFQGAGTTTLTGASTYTGGTTISAGTLAYGASNALADTGAINVNGGTLSLGAFSDTVGAVTLTSGAITGSTGVLSGSSYALQSGTVSGILGGTGSTLSKSTAGSVTLSVANTYTGATLVNGGTLTLSGTGSINSSSGITINGSGAKFLHIGSVASTPAITLTQGTLDGTGTVGAVTVGAGTGGVVTNGNGSTAKLTMSSLTFAGGGTLTLNLAGGATTTEALTVTNAFTTSGIAGSVTVNLVPVTAFNNITYNLLGYGSFSGNLSDFVVGTGLTSRQTGTFGLSGNFLTLAISGDAPKWTGLDNGNWVVGTTGPNKNWKLITGGTATNYIEGDTVLFDDSATGTTTIDISAANVAPTLTTFNNSTLSYVIGSSGGFGISTGGLVKNGTGSVTFTNANSFTGVTTINAGSLNLQNSSALGATASVTVASGAALELQGGISVDARPLTISGAGLTASPAGALRNVSGTNSFAGLVTLAANSTIESDAGTLSLTNAGTITGSGFTLTLAGSGNGSIASIIGTGAGSVIKNGTGKWTLSGANTYTGGTVINAGTIIVGNASALGTGTLTFGASSNGTLTLNGNSITVGALNGDNTATINNNNATAATLTVNKAGGTDTFAGTLTDGTLNTLGLTKSGAGTLVLSGTNSYSGATTISGGTLQFNADVAMSSASPLTIANGGTLSLVADANTTFTPGSTTGSAGAATIAVNEITGAGAGKTLTLAGAFTIGTASGNSLTVSSTSGDTLLLSSQLALVNASGPNSTINLSGANMTLNAGVNFNSGTNGPFLTVNANSNTLVINGSWTTGGNRWSGIVLNSGTLTMANGQNGGGSFNNGVYATLNGGTLNLNSANAIGGALAGNNFTINGGTLDNTSGTAKTLSTNPVLTWNADFVFSTSGGTSANDLNLGTGAISLGTTAGTSRTITTNGTATLTLGGVISNGTTATGLIKAGTGNLALTGASTYTGVTTVSGGELIVKGSLNGTVNVSVASGATLASGVAGSITTASAGNVSVSGTLAPGDLGSVGTLTLAPGTGGQLSFLSGSTVDFTISGATSDEVSFSTAGDWLTGSGNVTLSLSGITAADYGNTYTVFHNASTAGFSFASISGYDSLDYTANFTQVGNDYQLSFAAVPEPGMPISLLGGAGVLCLLRRRRGQSRA